VHLEVRIALELADLHERLPVGRRQPLLGPAIAAALRDPLFYGQVPRASDVIYTCVAAAVALLLGALVFNRVDDRIAVEL